MIEKKCRKSLANLKGVDSREEYENRLDWELDAIRKSETTYAFYNAMEFMKRLDLKPWEVKCNGMSGASIVAYLCGISPVDPVKARLYPEFIYGLDGEKEAYFYFSLSKKKIEEMFECFDDIKVEGPLYRVLPNLDVRRDVSCSIVYYMAKHTGIDVNNITKFFVGTDNDIIPHIGFDEGKEAIEMLRPKDFDDLVKIIGLMHGSVVWENNGKDLVFDGICNIKNLIATREDVYETLMEYGIPKEKAFKITERVRKGMGIITEDEKLLSLHNLPEWFISFCKKVKYLYSRAHAYQDALNTWWCMWFKENYPEKYAKVYTENAYKKAFLYGLDKELVNKIIEHYDYAGIKFFDVTDAYTDLLAIPADYILVRTDNAKENELKTIEEYYDEVDAFEKSKFQFVTGEDLKEWEWWF